MRAKTIIAAILSAGLIAGLFFYISRRHDEEETVYRINPLRSDISITVSAAGYVRPRNRLEIKPPLAGRVEEILLREGDTVKAGEIIAWLSSSERAALLDAARARGEEELRKWKEVYRPTPVIAPLDGFIIRRNIEPGQSIGAQEAVLVMADELIIRAQVDETDLRKIAIGQEAKITLDAHPREKISGVLEHIAYESEVVSNVTVYNVDIRPLQGFGLMRSGMNAMVEALIEKSENALLVPTSAIEERNGLKFLRVETGNGIERREVETGISDGSNTEIVSGLNVRDTLIISLEPGSGVAGRFRGGLPGMGNR